MGRNLKNFNYLFKKGKMDVGFFASGDLGLDTIISAEKYIKPIFIATDSNSKQIIDYAEFNGIPLFKGNPRNGKLKQFLLAYSAEIVFSINYLFIIEEEVINEIKFPINFHGSLLPKYRGRTPHVWSIINGESTTGVTAHIIDQGCDTGPIVLQYEVPINNQDTGADILNKYKLIYPKMLHQVWHDIKEENLNPFTQNESEATFFGKRTPEDGEINWNWDKTKIMNWVRAQAFPYPGAFTYIKNIKIVIDKVNTIDSKEYANFQNGYILSDYPEILVKVSDGIISIETVRENGKLLIKGQNLGK